MFNIQQFLFRVGAWVRFYLRAVTKYQVHSPFVFQWITDVLEDDRNYYVFGAISALRNRILMQHAPLRVTDFGAGPSGSLAGNTGPVFRTTTPAEIGKHATSDPRQGQMLFKMALLHQPKYVLELGTSLGLGTLYMAHGAPSSAQMITLEGCPNVAQLARLHLETLDKKRVQVIAGPFEQTLEPALANFPQLDFVYFDGNHQEAPTLRYFEQCLPKAHANTVFIFDDVHWSAGMEKAWAAIQQHPKVTLTIDCGYFACAYFNPEFVEKQHFTIVSSAWKPWKIF